MLSFFNEPVSLKEKLSLSSSPSSSPLPLLATTTAATITATTIPTFEEITSEKEAGVIIFDNYFAVCATDFSCLVSLSTEDSVLYHIVTDVSYTLEDGTQIVYFYGEQSIVSTESSAVS
jgi:hypothetical protein